MRRNHAPGGWAWQARPGGRGGGIYIPPAEISYVPQIRTDESHLCSVVLGRLGHACSGLTLNVRICSRQKLMPTYIPARVKLLRLAPDVLWPCRHGRSSTADRSGTFCEVQPAMATFPSDAGGSISHQLPTHPLQREASNQSSKSLLRTHRMHATVF